MTEFVITRESPIKSCEPDGLKKIYQKVGRALVHGSDLWIIVDGRGWYYLDSASLRVVLLLGGSIPVRNKGGRSVGVAELSASGRSLVLEEVGVLLIVRDLKRVLSGESRRAAVWVVQSPS